MHKALDKHHAGGLRRRSPGTAPAKQAPFPDRWLALECELSLVQTRLHHLVEAIANGRETEGAIQALGGEDTRMQAPMVDLNELDALTQTVSLDKTGWSRR